MKIIIKKPHKSVVVSTLFKRLTYQCEPVGFHSLLEETDLLLSYDCLINIWITIKIMLKTFSKNIYNYEEHVNVGISVYSDLHRPLKRLSLLKSVSFLCLQPHAAVISRTFSWQFYNEHHADVCWMLTLL